MKNQLQVPYPFFQWPTTGMSVVAMKHQNKKNTATTYIRMYRHIILKAFG